MTTRQCAEAMQPYLKDAFKEAMKIAESEAKIKSQKTCRERECNIFSHMVKRFGKPMSALTLNIIFLATLLLLPIFLATFFRENYIIFCLVIGGYVMIIFIATIQYKFVIIKKSKIISVALRTLVSILLLLALESLKHDYYTILRWITCTVGIYSAILAYNLQKKAWVWLLTILALFFNPLLPVKLEKETWQVINVISSILFLISTFFV